MSSSSSSKLNPATTMSQNTIIADKSRTSSISSGKQKEERLPPRPRNESRNSGGRNRKSKIVLEGIDAAKGRLHHLFIQIENEFDVILNENNACKFHS